MSDDQISNALGQIMGKLNSLDDHVRDHIVVNRVEHKEFADTIDEHSAMINQAKGAKGAIFAMAAAIAAAVGMIGAKLGKWLS